MFDGKYGSGAMTDGSYLATSNGFTLPARTPATVLRLSALKIH
jgi:hypothetical protein